MQKFLVTRNILAAALLCAAGTLSSSAADAQAGNICQYLKKIVPTAKSEFEEWKGTEDTVFADHTTFDAILTPGQGIKCTLFVRRKIGRDENPPLDNCILVENLTHDQALVQYKAATDQLRACYPAVKFSEETGGDLNDRSEYQSFSGKQQGAEIKLTLSDMGALAEAFAGTHTDKPGVGLELGVTDTLPAPKTRGPVPVIK
jgi:hypothetical protein